MLRPNISASALRVFEVASRLLSFEKAAIELHITPSAVSQQISRLEEKIGCALFVRQHRKVQLSAEGRAMSTVFIEAFKAIDDALALAYQSAGNDAIKLSIYQTWASRWLIPKISSFSKEWPQLSVEFVTGMETVELAHSDVDFAIRWLPLDEVRANDCKLFDEVLVAVCAPVLAAKINSINDFGVLRWIYSVNRPHDWSLWLTANGCRDQAGAGSMKFSNTSLSIDAAVAGAGVLVGQAHLFLPEIEAGSLLVPIKSGVKTHRSLYLLESSTMLSRTASTAFRNWVLLEAAQTSQRANKVWSQVIDGFDYAQKFKEFS